MRPLRWLYPVLLIAACSAEKHSKTTAPAQPDVRSENETFLAWTDEVARSELLSHPLYATSFFRGATDFVGAKYNDKLSEVSVGEIEAKKRIVRNYLERMRSFDRGRLSGTAATTYDVLLEHLQVTNALAPYVHGAFDTLGVYSPYSISQISGPHINIPQALENEHPLRNLEDAEDYLSRLQAFANVITNMVEVVEHDAKEGVLAPRFAIDGARTTILALVQREENDHFWLESFKRRLEKESGLDDGIRAQLADRARMNLREVSGALVQLHAHLGPLSLEAREDAGLWALDNGAERYRLALENFGAAGKTPDEIHAIGLAEVERIQSEMAAILAREGHAGSTPIGHYVQLSEDPRYLYPDTPAGKEQLLTDVNAQVVEVTKRLPEIFGTTPKAGVIVKRIPVHEQDNAPGGYYMGPSVDGKRPGIYWINLKSTRDWPKFALPTLTYHEANPGHHLQNAIALEVDDMPMLRKLMWFSQYGEGWALYAEVLAKELGLYDDDPLGDLGRLQSELFRAARLVVDTGIHHKRWTRAEAISYMREATGESVESITREVNRYAVWPGQACSYKLGQLRILELREHAREELGDAFDLREFHDVLLVHGAVPLGVLGRQVEQWIASKSRGAITRERRGRLHTRSGSRAPPRW